MRVIHQRLLTQRRYNLNDMTPLSGAMITKQTAVVELLRQNGGHE